MSDVLNGIQQVHQHLLIHRFDQVPIKAGFFGLLSIARLPASRLPIARLPISRLPICVRVRSSS